ncbi:hypothetical protein LCGC14_1788240 [marine sediment metagenome]|uniref:Uncharacterized protein n=1 Tax=marine sediment metagenome TaxID=412755 RepID=A0A0F9GTA3_9ZZZZ
MGDVSTIDELTRAHYNAMAERAEAVTVDTALLARYRALEPLMHEAASRLRQTQDIEAAAYKALNAALVEQVRA